MVGVRAAGPQLRGRGQSQPGQGGHPSREVNNQQQGLSTHSYRIHPGISFGGGGGQAGESTFTLETGSQPEAPELLSPMGFSEPMAVQTPFLMEPCCYFVLGCEGLRKCPKS